jgi:nicotinate-nucleotide adenylyltransferase
VKTKQSRSKHIPQNPTPTLKQKIAIFGGSFDPIHCGHIEIAKQARTVANLDEIIFLPCRRSPHKPQNPIANTKHRVEMIKIATRTMSWAEVSSWEINRVPPSYSWMAAEYFHDTFPQADLYWILGNDQWEKIHTWYKPARLAEALTFIVFPRDTKPVKKNGFRSLFINASHPASSSEARDCLGKCKTTGKLLTRGVSSYIEEQQIYAPKALAR